jgi:hypothetical protein
MRGMPIAEMNETEDELGAKLASPPKKRKKHRTNSP